MDTYRVKDLIRDLKKLDGELPVMVQSDPEGNDYHRCRGADVGTYRDGAVEEYDSTDNENACCVVYP